MNPRLVRTGHFAEQDNSVFMDDHRVIPFRPFGPQSTAFAIFDSRNEVPVNNTDVIPSFSDTLPRCPPKGAIFCTSDFQPGGASPIHRTLSLDYCIVLFGEIVLRLDNGQEKVVKAGEFIVQQGANHQWLNRSDRVCRVGFVMLGAHALRSSEGEPLEPAVD